MYYLYNKISCVLFYFYIKNEIKVYDRKLIIWEILVSRKKYTKEYYHHNHFKERCTPRKRTAEIHNKIHIVLFLRHKIRGAFIQKFIIVWYVSSSPFYFAPPFSNEYSVSSVGDTDCWVQANVYVYNKGEREYWLPLISY